jgi:hypothetical protein
MNTEVLNQFYHSFNSIDTLIEGFKLCIPMVQPHSTREMLVVHSLVHVATIQLHNPFVVEIDTSRLRVLGSARAIVANLVQAAVNEFVYIDPIMGVRRPMCTQFLILTAMNSITDFVDGHLPSIHNGAGPIEATSAVG